MQFLAIFSCEGHLRQRLTKDTPNDLVKIYVVLFITLELMSLKVSWYLVKIDPLQLFGDEGVVEPLQLVRRNIQPPEIGSNVLKTFNI